MEKTDGHLISPSPFPCAHKHNSWTPLNQSLEQEITLPAELHLKSEQAEADYYRTVMAHTCTQARRSALLLSHRLFNICLVERRLLSEAMAPT